MTFSARYENGVFRPLHDVRVREGAIVEVYLPAETSERSSLIGNSTFAGMWKDHEDLADRVEYVNRLRGELHG